MVDDNFDQSSFRPSPPPVRSPEPKIPSFSEGPKRLSDFAPPNLPTKSGSSPSVGGTGNYPKPEQKSPDSSQQPSQVRPPSELNLRQGGVPSDVLKSSQKQNPPSLDNQIPPSKQALNIVSGGQKPPAVSGGAPASKNTTEPAGSGGLTEPKTPRGPVMLRSSVRTMKKDIEALKQGQEPRGMETQKIAEEDDEEKIKEEEAKEETIITEEAPEIELGDIERSKSIEPERPRSFTLTYGDEEDEFETEDKEPERALPGRKEEITEPSGPRQSFSVRKGREKGPGTETDRSMTGFESPAKPVSSILNRISSLFSRGKKKDPEIIARAGEEKPGNVFGPSYSVSSPPGIKIPALKKLRISPKLIIIILGLLVLGGGGWYFINREQQFITDPTPIITPQGRATPTPLPPSPSPISDVLTAAFGSRDMFTLNLGIDPLSNFNNFVQSQELNQSELKAYTVHDDNGIRYRFDKLLAQFLIEVPEDLLNNLNTDNFIMLVFNPGFGEQNETGFVVEVSDSIRATSALRIWEGTMSDDFKDLFNFDVQKAASPGFLDNVHEGITIRYRNFPEPVDTIDYTVVTMANGDNYLIIINSRKSVYNIIDRLLESGAK